MSLRPLGANVLIKVEEARNTTESGLIVSEKADKPCKGLVLAIGSECKWVKEGDSVYFNKYSPEKLGDHNLIMESHILAVETV